MNKNENAMYERAFVASEEISKIVGRHDEMTRELVSSMLFDLLAGEEPRKVAQWFADNWDDVPLERILSITTLVEPEMRKRGLGDLSSVRSELAAILLGKTDAKERPQ